MTGARPVAIGAMHITDGAVLDAALAAGVTLIDTADVYGRDEADAGNNERLVAAAVARHPAAGGPPITVVTKGGLVRRDARWIADGRGQHLAAAARASRDRLGVDILDTYLLHAPDPQVPLATSVRALARLVEDGVVRRIGLSNVGRTQLLEALAITPIAAVEIELGPHDVDAIRGGLVALCAERGIAVLAYRPLGGAAKIKRWRRDGELRLLAGRHDATPIEVLLAWLGGLSPILIPLPGPTTVASATSCGRAGRLVLDDDARAALDRRFLGASAGRVRGAPPAAAIPTAAAHELVILMGMPGAGKSTLAAELLARGHRRFNRDERGGTLDQLATALDAALAESPFSAVLDNTYATRASRAPVIDIAARHGLPVRCLWLDTTIEDAQVNAAARLLERYDRLPEPAELNKLTKKDPGAFRPGAQFTWRRELEPPALDEGFAAVEHIPFVRRPPTAAAGARPALILDLDDVIRVGRPTRPDDVVLQGGVAAALARWAAAGWALAATAWQPDPAADIAATDARTAALAGVPLPIATCPHPAGPPICWCRKPLPGLGLLLARRHHLDLARSIHISRNTPADRGFAARLGLRFADPETLLAPPLALH